MRIISMFAVIAAWFAFAPVANADVKWESKGWVKLGERDVDGKVDRDVIVVGKHEGKFSKLTLLVDKSDLELLDFEITFGNGQKHNPNVKHVFKEGQRTRVLDFPGGDRVIKYIDMKYANLPGGGKARVEVWAK